ncbi:hypothetical protein LTR99_010069 [Exophiala xenobiotica]|uniref:Uncharacterized protein n=1 Tax=Vermiconidia calcicola TaxID=1690605 RepID=A0AAV9PVK1_9PEZI|nr:hypothetical protein LTR92_002039 [Exophiala xenobiotica]KAK5529520.1 hypothetical protein LTR25_009769 [Vermiconidia calcicola]KAK5532622.1 hypothetical protein LTR23_009512 [Chaetothyriales sp. CCFEE 6169]KAK5242113.1 hypothetical protein LTS06_011727 [Exophiala xenobiotica]KAK5269231.1 hypothetical protein LTR96_006015 [Exophiala xenobiotica]
MADNDAPGPDPIPELLARLDQLIEESTRPLSEAAAEFEAFKVKLAEFVPFLSLDTCETIGSLAIEIPGFQALVAADTTQLTAFTNELRSFMEDASKEIDVYKKARADLQFKQEQLATEASVSKNALETQKNALETDFDNKMKDVERTRQQLQAQLDAFIKASTLLDEKEKMNNALVKEMKSSLDAKQDALNKAVAKINELELVQRYLGSDDDQKARAMQDAATEARKEEHIRTLKEAEAGWDKRLQDFLKDTNATAQKLREENKELANKAAQHKQLLEIKDGECRALRKRVETFDSEIIAVKREAVANAELRVTEVQIQYASILEEEKKSGKEALKKITSVTAFLEEEKKSGKEALTTITNVTSVLQGLPQKFLEKVAKDLQRDHLSVSREYTKEFGDKFVGLLRPILADLKDNVKKLGADVAHLDNTDEGIAQNIATLTGQWNKTVDWAHEYIKELADHVTAADNDLTEAIKAVTAVQTDLSSDKKDLEGYRASLTDKERQLSVQIEQQQRDLQQKERQLNVQIEQQQQNLVQKDKKIEELLEQVSLQAGIKQLRDEHEKVVNVLN